MCVMATYQEMGSQDSIEKYCYTFLELLVYLIAKPEFITHKLHRAQETRTSAIKPPITTTKTTSGAIKKKIQIQLTTIITAAAIDKNKNIKTERKQQ